MAENRKVRDQDRRASRRWVIWMVVAVLAISSLGCSLVPLARLAGRLEPVALADDAQYVSLATYTPWPTFTPIALSPPSPTPTATWLPWPTPTATDTPIPTATAAPTLTPLPTATPRPTDTPLPARPTATSASRVIAAASSPVTPTPSSKPVPGYDYLVDDVYIDRTTVPFLTGYIAIVNAQEIPIGGVKAVGVFEPGGQRHESPLSKWFFDVATAPGVVAKTGSVKFEPGGIQAGTWLIHLEDEWGTRLSEDVTINTNPDNPEWFYVKFKQRGLAVAVASAPTPTRSSNAAASTASGGSATSTKGWSFLNVRVSSDTGTASVILYGDMVNNTGAAQEILYLTGTFTDDNGRAVDGENYTYDYWPVDVVPPGGRVPFELEVYGIKSIQDYSLRVVFEPSGSTPRQDFEVSELGGYDDGWDYCVTGGLRNLGVGLSEYLVITAVLYDDQDNVINFDGYDVWYPQEVAGDQGEDFEVCVDPLGQQVADYEVRAWGQ